MFSPVRLDLPACMQVRNYYDIPGSVKQILKDLDLESLNLLLLPADGSMETIRVSLPFFTPALRLAVTSVSGIMGI